MMKNNLTGREIKVKKTLNVSIRPFFYCTLTPFQIKIFNYMQSSYE